ncbi:MAG TPA: ThuA domain-containing protein [Candidatus Hydrogenedentes bacterium]|nr:ThuA domain-containing protein [Candidatus Hydrogenedentota bacterium]
MTIRVLLAASVALLITLTGYADAEKPLKILFLSKSSGFEHSVIKRENGQPSLVDRVLTALAPKLNAEVVCTKDADMFTPDGLKAYDVIIFYTTGDLTQPSEDGGKPMPPDGQQVLLDWIKAGGGFVGYHSASDSFHSNASGVTPYVEMIGGEFETHGKQFKGRLRVVSPGHPAIASLQDGYELWDEWYINKNINRDAMHVLALLELGKERQRQPDKYNVPDYPIIWCREYGKGRVLYNGLGHREDVWESDAFQKIVVDNILWAAGKGAAMAEPNYHKVVPKEIPAE